MERSLLDTDTLSDVMRGRDAAVRSKADAYLSVFGHFTISVITVSEMIDGLRRKRQDARVMQLLTMLDEERHEVIALDFEAAKLAGYIFGDLHRIGQSIGGADPFIAAIAIQSRTPLVTGNLEHYERIQALGYPLILDSWRSIKR